MKYGIHLQEMTSYFKRFKTLPNQYIYYVRKSLLVKGPIFVHVTQPCCKNVMNYNAEKILPSERSTVT